MASTTRKRSGGRESRHKLRAAPPPFNPCPPGQIGGQYKPLSQTDLESIYECAIALLEKLGMGDVPKKLKNDLLKIGATIGEQNRIVFPRTLIEDVIAKAPKKFIFHGLDENRSIEIGGDHVYFGTGGAAVQTLDIESGRYRPSTIQDLHNFTKLQDTLDNVAWFTRCCVATDLTDNFDLDVQTVYALIKNTTKPIGTSFTLAEHIPPIVEMLDIAAGGENQFAKRPFLKAHISPIISPMKYGEDAVDVVYSCIENNIPISCITAAQAGATAPATMAGFLAQSLAETLASLIMVHAIQPNYPMIFSNWPLVIDLRSGAFAGGGGETALLNAASAQISNWLGLISGVAASMSDAKAIDAQYGVEKGMTSLAAALGGGNLIYESSGMTGALLGASFEAFVLDNEMHANNYRILRGIEVNEENLGFDAICNSVLGEGHFLGSDHTYQAMERDYYYPDIADRTDPNTWQQSGAVDAWQMANQKAKYILKTHQPEYLNPQIDQKIRAQFNI